MRLHLHPKRCEALTSGETTLTRWSLATNPASRLVQHSTAPFSPFEFEILQDGRRATFGEITGAPDGALFALQQMRLQEYLHTKPCVIELRHWEDLSPARTITVPQAQGWIESLDSSPDGRWLVLSPWSPERIFLLDRQTGEVMSHHATGGSSTTGLTFDPTSTFVAGVSSNDGGGYLRLWRLDPAECFVPQPAMEDWWSRGLPTDHVNGSMALSVVHWDLDREGVGWPYSDLADTVGTVVFSPDSHIVVFSLVSAYSSSRLDLTAYEVTSGKRLWCIRSDVDCSGQCVFTPDSRALIVPEQDGDLCVYRVADGILQQRLSSGLNEPVQALAFDRDGRALWLATEEELVQYQSQR